jgi:hypothetical protein
MNLLARLRVALATRHHRFVVETWTSGFAARVPCVAPYAWESWLARKVSEMAQRRFCYECGREVRCKEELRPITGSTRSLVRLSCALCGRTLADLYDSELQITKTRKG